MNEKILDYFKKEVQPHINEPNGNINVWEQIWGNEWKIEHHVDRHIKKEMNVWYADHRNDFRDPGYILSLDSLDTKYYPTRNRFSLSYERKYSSWRKPDDYQIKIYPARSDSPFCDKNIIYPTSLEDAKIFFNKYFPNVWSEQLIEVFHCCFFNKIFLEGL